MAGQPDQRLGKYQLTRPIKETTFAVVYRGDGVVLHNEVAVKVLKVRLTEKGERAQFEEEAHLLRKLVDQRYVVQVLDYGWRGDQPYLVMDYLANGSLRKMLTQQGPQTPGSILPAVRAIAEALGYVHKQRIIHGNLKPENILWGRNGEPLLTDFGLTALLPLRIQVADHTAAYLAPELRQGGDATPACDQYALGVMIYEWLTGKLPPQGGLASLRQFAPTLSAQIEEVVQMALAPDPAKRFATITAFATAFESACQPAQPPVQMSELRPSPDAALAPVSQEPVRPALTPATPAPASAAKKRSQAESQAAVLESARHAAPPPFKLWEPYGPVPPPDDDEIAAWRAGVAGWTGLPASGAGGLARKPGGLFIPIAAVLVLVLLAGSLTAFGAAGLGPLGFLHGPKPIVTSTLRPSPSAVTQMPAGHSTIVIRQSDPITVLPAQQKTVTASCQSGEQLVGGGYAITPSAVALTADASYPSGLSTWTATLTNDMQQPVRLSVFATCLPSSTNLAIQLVRSNPTIFASAENAPPAVARCPAPGVSIGGGFSTTPASNGVVISSLPGPSQQAWSVTASAANSPLTITAYALCATVHLANRLTPMQSLTITPGKVNQTMVTCAADGLLTSAGFSDTSATTAGSLFFPAIQPEPGATSWQMSAYTSDTKTTHTAKITAVCIKVL